MRKTGRIYIDSAKFACFRQMPPSWIEYGASNLYRQTSRLNGGLQSNLQPCGSKRRAFGENGRSADVCGAEKIFCMADG